MGGKDAVSSHLRCHRHRHTDTQTMSRVLYAMQPETVAPPEAISQGPFAARFAVALSSLPPTARSAAIAALNAPPPPVSSPTPASAPVSAASADPPQHPQQTAPKAQALTEAALLSALDSLRTEKRKIFMSIASAMERQEAAHQQRLQRKRLREETKDETKTRKKKKQKKNPKDNEEQNKSL